MGLDKEKEFEQGIWETYRNEWETAGRERRQELDRRTSRWQELMAGGLAPSLAYDKAMEIDVRKEITQVVTPVPVHRSRRPWALIATAVILAWVAIAGAVYGLIVTQERDSLRTELVATRSALATAQSELNATKLSVAAKQSELDSTKHVLASTQSELKTTRQTLDSFQKDSTNLQATLTKAQQQLAVARETLSGLGITLSASPECYDVDLVDNPAAKNPTLSQLMDFLAKDYTENHSYIARLYDCSQFSRDVHNNAEAAGIRAAEVQIMFKNEFVGHALNAFLTTDYGLVYVDCTKAPDKFARVVNKKEYRAVGVNEVSGENLRNDYWWDSLGSYFYFPSAWESGHSVTSSINIYW
ncbi:MAG: hypothetical protein V1767_04555 [Chloroflexota bacterium]